jgi:hypothetical protein
LSNQLSSILELKNFYLVLVDDEDRSEDQIVVDDEDQTAFEFSTNHVEQHMLTNAVIALKESIVEAV